jgi:hypothetical protein
VSCQCNTMSCADTLANMAKGTMPLSIYQMQFNVKSSIPPASGQCPSSVVQLDPLLAGVGLAKFRSISSTRHQQSRIDPAA